MAFAACSGSCSAGSPSSRRASQPGTQSSKIRRKCSSSSWCSGCSGATSPPLENARTSCVTATFHSCRHPQSASHLSRTRAS
eukprot:13809609-Alexandrium_andersonii.AAC.1